MFGWQRDRSNEARASGCGGNLVSWIGRRFRHVSKEAPLRTIPSVLATAVFALTLLAASAASAQTTFHACVLGSKNGQLRLVSGPGLCKANETQVQWESGADLSQVTAAIEAVASRVGAVEQAVAGLPALEARVDALSVLPPTVPLSVRDAAGRGNPFGCDLVAAADNEPVFRVRCNEFADITELKTGTAVFLPSPPDMAYTYDGLYLCGIASQGLRDRPQPLRLSIYFHELVIDDSGERIMQRRDNSLDVSRRSLKFEIPATAFTPLEVDSASSGQRPCVTLRFAQGTPDGGQPGLPNGIWTPETEVDIFISMPPMLPTFQNQFGDFLLLSQAGLTVAGRRPAAP